MSKDGDKVTLVYIHIHAVYGAVLLFYIILFIAPDIVIYQFRSLYNTHGHAPTFQIFIVIDFREICKVNRVKKNPASGILFQFTVL